MADALAAPNVKAPSARMLGCQGLGGHGASVAASPGRHGPRVGRLAHLSASADAAPFPHETPLPEQVGLHVEPGRTGSCAWPHQCDGG